MRGVRIKPIRRRRLGLTLSAFKYVHKWSRLVCNWFTSGFSVRCFAPRHRLAVTTPPILLPGTLSKWCRVNLSWEEGILQRVGGCGGGHHCTHSSSSPTSIRAKQTDRLTDRQREEDSLTFLPFGANEIPAYPQWGRKKVFLQYYLPFLLVYAGDLQRPTEVLPFLCESLLGRRGGKHTALPFSANLHVFTSAPLCFHHPPTTDPQIPLCSQYGCNMNERTQGAVCDSLCRVRASI